MRLIWVWIVFTWRNEQWVLCTKFATLLLILREKNKSCPELRDLILLMICFLCLQPTLCCQASWKPLHHTTFASSKQQAGRRRGCHFWAFPHFPLQPVNSLSSGFSLLDHSLSSCVLAIQVAPSNILRHPSLPCYRVCRTLFHVFLLILFLVGPQPLYCSGPNFSLELDIPHSPFPRTPLSGLILPQSPLQTYPPSWIINSHVC